MILPSHPMAVNSLTDDSKKFLDRAFWRDFERNGPSLFRICRTTPEGWRRYRDRPDRRIRQRFEGEIASLKNAYSGVLWAMEKHLKLTNAAISQQIESLRQELHIEFGSASRLASALLGPLMLWTTRREEKRLASGATYEPKTFIERRNWASS